MMASDKIFFEIMYSSQNVFKIVFKRTQRTQRSFAKNLKERKERNILMQKNAKELRTLHSFEKNARPTLVLFLNIYL